jgi:hypothetical protein
MVKNRDVLFGPSYRICPGDSAVTSGQQSAIVPPMFELLVAVCWALRASLRSRLGLVAENLALRQQLGDGGFPHLIRRRE